MTGPEHYREAERLLAAAAGYADDAAAAVMTARAQAHATLAVAAAAWEEVRRGYGPLRQSVGAP